MTLSTWKEKLKHQMPEDLAEEIDVFETQMQMRCEGMIEEKIFAETRLRRGMYGQRYDNGQRNNGLESVPLGFEERPMKGPDTYWDAPGMMRIKIPWGGVSPEQLELLADLSEEYSDGITHVTTRQDVQLHYVHIDDAPDLMRRLAAVGITTREACGNSIRNVTACPFSGVCNDESFDATPYAEAIKDFLLGHPDAQNFGRKFKISFSGCVDHACGLSRMHDMGFIARKRIVDGVEERGFEVHVGGGLGAVPHQAKVLETFVPETEILPLAQAACRVFARLGEKKNRAKARLKFLIAKIGIEEFRKLLYEERALLEYDPRWTSFLEDLGRFTETPVSEPGQVPEGALPEGFSLWSETNLKAQAQQGYALATVSLPLGDATAPQLRSLADISRKYNGGHMRFTVEQNVVLRWVSLSDAPDLYTDLSKVGLGQPGAGTLVDITACPGTDTCKLGISSSRGLAGELRSRLAEQAFEMDRSVRDLRIKVSGCFNACGQHHVSDIGFYGVSRKVGGRTVPHFQVVLGGRWKGNASSFGLACGAVPSKNIPNVVTRLTEDYLKERDGEECFQDYVTRIGKVQVKSKLQELIAVPDYLMDPSFYSDWGDPREYTLGDMGIGECAGEVVSMAEFGLTESEREVFNAQILLDDGKSEEAGATAYKAMLIAAKALVSEAVPHIKDEEDMIVAEFRARYYDTKLFFDPFAKGKFASYLFKAHEEGDAVLDADLSRQRIEEAQLFIEAAFSCHMRMSS
jgi:sulfite reductase (ferredoxin)